VQSMSVRSAAACSGGSYLRRVRTTLLSGWQTIARGRRAGWIQDVGPCFVGRTWSTKSEDFIASFPLHLFLQRSRVFSHVFFEKILMTLGCLRWLEGGTVDGELERSQYVVVTLGIKSNRCTFGLGSRTFLGMHRDLQLRHDHDSCDDSVPRC
jgi:hypothetical protein